MHQHQIRIMNHPEPTARETYVRKATQAYALGREWGETAASGLEELLCKGHQARCGDLIRMVRERRILSVQATEEIRWLAEVCAKTVEGLVDCDAPATRRKAGLLTANELELRALAAAVDEALDLEHALRALRQIGLRP